MGEGQDIYKGPPKKYDTNSWLKPKLYFLNLSLVHCRTANCVAFSRRCPIASLQTDDNVVDSSHFSASVSSKQKFAMVLLFY